MQFTREVKKKWDRYGVVGALLLGSAIGAGFSFIMPNGTSDTPVTPLMMAESAAANVEVDGRQIIREEQDRLEEVILTAERHVVKVSSQACGVNRQGTASLLQHDGSLWLVTNNHVVEGASSVTVELPSGDEVFVDVLGPLAGRDLALLDPAPFEDQPVADTLVEPIPIGRRVEVGQPIAVVGFPANEFELQQGWVSTSDRRFSNGEASNVIILDVPVVGGHSGGLVIGPDGGATAIIAAQDPATGGGVAYHVDDVTKRPLRSLASCP